MNPLKNFYEKYHRKNGRFSKVIPRDNFTYFYILNFLHTVCRDTFTGLHVLDVGCGVGTLALYLGKHGADVTGIDLSSRAIELAQDAQQQIGVKQVKFIQGELKQRKKSEPQFDMVICSEVIEHIPDDEHFLRILHSHLKDHGHLLLTTPSSESFWNRVGFYKKFDEDVGHLRRYTKTGLTSLFTHSGFEIVELRERDGIFRNVLFTTKLEFLIRFIRGPLVPLFHCFDMMTVHLFGAGDIQVLARKRARS